ncbi:hypothetical protein E4U59_005338, partial [Claviceps monticola]
KNPGLALHALLCPKLGRRGVKYSTTTTTTIPSSETKPPCRSYSTMCTGRSHRLRQRESASPSARFTAFRSVTSAVTR